MHSVKLLSAAVALGAGLVSAQSTCTEEINISEPTPSIDCKVIDADVTVDESVAGELAIEGPEQIKGDFTVRNATGLLSLSSSTLESIDGVFELNALTVLSSLKMSSLKSIQEIRLINLQQLAGLTFGTSGVSKATTVQVSDTRIADLSGLNLATVQDFRIDNNDRLNKFDSDLVNITGTLIIQNNGNSNGNQMQINMTHLEMASEIQLGNVKSFSTPALKEIGQSIKFDKNPELKTYMADNLTKIGESLTFINNNKLANISFEGLEQVTGDITIQNNTALKELDTFPEVNKVGSLLLAGTFEKVEMPKLEDVTGTVTVTSTTDIKEFCDYFDTLKEDGKVSGDEKCTSNNDDALENGDGGEESDGSSQEDGDDSAAGIASVNMAVLGLAAFAGIAQLL